MKQLLACLILGALLAACTVEYSEFAPTATPIPEAVREAQEREFTQRERIAADLERNRIAATAEAYGLQATAIAQTQADAHATAIAPSVQATAQAQQALALQAEQTQAQADVQRTSAIVWGVVAIVGIAGACVAVYVWQMGRVKVEAMRQGYAPTPPARQLPSPEQWEIMQAAAAQRGQRLELQGNTLLLVDKQTGHIVKAREI